jgi:hypothetical protein
MISDRSHPLTLMQSAARDRLALVYVPIVCFAIAAVVLVVFVASFVTLWPYNLHLSMRHYASRCRTASRRRAGRLGVALIAL